MRSSREFAQIAVDYRLSPLPSKGSSFPGGSELDEYESDEFVFDDKNASYVLAMYIGGCYIREMSPKNDTIQKIAQKCPDYKTAMSFVDQAAELIAVYIKEKTGCSVTKDEYAAVKLYLNDTYCSIIAEFSPSKTEENPAPCVP